MTATGPYRQWDGQQWVCWDGHGWVPELPWPVPEGGAAWSRTMVPAPQPAMAYWTAPGLVVTDQRDRPAMTIVAWIFTILTGLYFLPWAIAATRGKSNAGIIGLITLLLGWTVVGWIIALVMSFTAHHVVARRTAW